MNDVKLNPVAEALEIVAYHKDQVQEFIRHRFEAHDGDLVIAQNLLEKLILNYHLLKESTSLEKKQEAMQAVPVAFEQAAREKMAESKSKYLPGENELRSDKWSGYFLTMAGELTLKELILGFKQDDEKALLDLAVKMRNENSHGR